MLPKGFVVMRCCTSDTAIERPVISWRHSNCIARVGGINARGGRDCHSYGCSLLPFQLSSQDLSAAAMRSSPSERSFPPSRAPQAPSFQASPVEPELDSIAHPPRSQGLSDAREVLTVKFQRWASLVTQFLASAKPTDARA